MDAEQAGDAHPTLLDVILRDVAPSDDAALASFDPGPGTRDIVARRSRRDRAVRHDRQRTGLARLLVEAVIAEMQFDGVQSVSWLIHPANTASLAFSRSVFPDADESSPPEDDPYVRFVLGL